MKQHTAQAALTQTGHYGGIAPQLGDILVADARGVCCGREDGRGEDMSTETVDIKGGRQVDAVEMIEQTHPQLCALNPNHNLAGSSQCLC